LVCIGYSGGGTVPFRGWATQLPDDTELVLVCYPGRENRFTEPFARDCAALRQEIVEAVTREVADRPFVLFGHSMGAIMAFDVAAELERLDAGPTALTVSACESPDVWQHDQNRPPHLGQTDAELLAWMSTIGQLPRELLDEPELVRMAIDLLRADLTVSSTYRYEPGTTVRAPMQVIYGVEDAGDPAKQAELWSRLGAGTVRVDELAGGHFYTPDVWANFPSKLAAFGG
jgi:surfactin synthase thioesterase subunit